MTGLEGVTPLRADVRRTAEVNAAFAEVEPAHGGLDVLVNGRGTAGPQQEGDRIRP